jgi:hypothetical protein
MHKARNIFLASFAAIVIIGAWLAPLDAPAIKQVDAGLKRALISFAAARTLNALISVAQGTELSAQPLGVGVTLTPGQALDPLNDVVEQFSTLMLAASIAFGIQKILISIGSYWLISLLVSAAALAWTWLHFRRRQAPAWLSRTLVVLLMLRFAIPVVTMGTELLSQKFLSAEYEASQLMINTSSNQVLKATPPALAGTESQGIVDTIKAWMAQPGELRQRFDNLKGAVEREIEHILKIIVIFMLQTTVIPFLLMWALYSVIRSAIELPRQAAKIG